MITMGEKGIALFEKGKPIRTIPTMAREVYDQGLADYLVSLGIMSANAVAGMKRSVLRRAA